MSATPTLDRATAFLAGAGRYPADVVDAAKQCLVDWLGVCLGALDDPAARPAIQLAAAWQTRGDAWLLTGGTATPAVAALVNGTLAHCLDFDDTHLDSVLHTSGPTWAATLALGTEQRRTGAALLDAFIAGFEVATKLGGNGLGVRISRQGWHSTGVLGRVSAAAAASVLRGLDRTRIGHALGCAATQSSGLVASFGTMAKPFHAGKAAMDGLIAAELAANGLEACLTAFDAADGLFASLLQDSAAIPRLDGLGERWEILRNAFKPYAACQLTHASIDAARALAPKFKVTDIAAVRARVSPMAAQIANKTRPTSPTEGKFSLAYCVASALSGNAVAAADFAPARIADADLQALSTRVAVLPTDGIERWGAELEVELRGGAVERATIPVALGSPENPMGWPDLERKFLALAEPVVGARAKPLLALLRHFETVTDLDELGRLLGRTPLGAAAE